MKKIISGKVSSKSPSNIAFVKYWGKYGRQLPMNPSISMTLKHCYTNCDIEFTYNPDQKKSKIIKKFLFEDKETIKFETRFEKYLQSIVDIFPEIENLELSIQTSNTFPHSAGIASSASAMSALCLCLEEIRRQISGSESVDILFASKLSRLASGSACRSLFSSFAIWGKSEFDSVDDYAIGYDDVHENFKNLCDSVLIISADEKSVSSSAGHSLMDNHIYREARMKQANVNFKLILEALNKGDFETFGSILESEALSLHAMMMSSIPSYILLEPNSILAIEKIKEFRDETKLPLYFTIDAGPNIHLIYPDSIKHKVLGFISSELAPLCYQKKVIHDEIGEGASLL